MDKPAAFGLGKTETSGLIEAIQKRGSNIRPSIAPEVVAGALREVTAGTKGATSQVEVDFNKRAPASILWLGKGPQIEGIQQTSQIKRTLNSNKRGVNYDATLKPTLNS